MEVESCKQFRQVILMLHVSQKNKANAPLPRICTLQIPVLFSHFSLLRTEKASIGIEVWHVMQKNVVACWTTFPPLQC
jgi:hypothetical protein